MLSCLTHENGGLHSFLLTLAHSFIQNLYIEPSKVSTPQRSSKPFQFRFCSKKRTVLSVGKRCLYHQQPVNRDKQASSGRWLTHSERTASHPQSERIKNKLKLSAIFLSETPLNYRFLHGSNSLMTWLKIADWFS